MKKLSTFIIMLAVALVFQNCSTVKVMDAWKSDDVSTTKDNNFIVVARTANKQARIAFENEIVKQMTSKGYKATASFTKLPNLNPDEEANEEKRAMLKQILEDEGFDGVVLTILKDYQEETRVSRDGGYYAGGAYYGYYPRYYGGFYGYYGHPMAYSTMGSYVPESTTVSTSKIYILETVVYDLTKAEDNQLVAVVTSKVDNPSNVTSTAEEYVKKITESLKDK